MRSTSKTSLVHKVGFISPPAWFDISPSELLRIAPSNTVVMQTIMRLPDFDYSIEQFKKAVLELGVCFNSLVSAGADVVAQFGYPFSLVHGWGNAQQIQKNVQGESKTSYIMMGIEVVHALRHLDCKSIAIASTYYSERMTKILIKYLTEAGLNISYFENWQSQGKVDNAGKGSFIKSKEFDPMDWKTSANVVKKAVRNVNKNTTKADCILITGGGMRVLDLVEPLEKEIRKPIIGGDVALYWGILRRLDIKKNISGHGKLLASLV